MLLSISKLVSQLVFTFDLLMRTACGKFSPVSVLALVLFSAVGALAQDQNATPHSFLSQSNRTDLSQKSVPDTITPQGCSLRQLEVGQ
jgi:hypothetical protein